MNHSKLTPLSILQIGALVFGGLFKPASLQAESVKSPLISQQSEKSESSISDSGDLSGLRKFSSVKRSSYPGYRRGHGWRLGESVEARSYWPQLDTGYPWTPSLGDLGGQLSISHSLPYCEWLNHVVLMQAQLTHGIPRVTPDFSRYHNPCCKVLPAAGQLSFHWRYFEETFRLSGNAALAGDYNDHAGSVSLWRVPMLWGRFGLSGNYKKDFRAFGELMFGGNHGREMKLQTNAVPDDFKGITDNLRTNWLKKDDQAHPTLEKFFISPASGWRVGTELWLFSLFGIRYLGLGNLSTYATFAYSGIGSAREGGQSTPQSPSMLPNQAKKCAEAKEEHSKAWRFSGYGLEKGLRWRLAPGLALEFGCSSFDSEVDQGSIVQALYKLLLGRIHFKVHLNYASNLSLKDQCLFSPARVKNLRAGSAARVDLCEDMNLCDRFLNFSKAKTPEQIQQEKDAKAIEDANKKKSK